jgi:hypothetical protein
MSNNAHNAVSTEIELMRGGNVVSTLTGAFGQSLKETRLTAILGYLIALEPKPFQTLFGFSGVAQRVRLETNHTLGRSDILVETSDGIGIVEAKVDATDPLKQARRYPADWVSLLTYRMPAKPVARAQYVSWSQLAVPLNSLGQSASPRVRIIARDLIKYMQEHHMIKNPNSVEIYAREINEPVTLALFLKARLYGCKYEATSRLSEALYFAPHFGRKITDEYPGVNIGISYVARIESLGQVVTWKEFRKLIHKERGGFWWKRHASTLEGLRRAWPWNTGELRSILLLHEPRLVFNPPVRKENLQRGKGWLSKRFFSFDELFVAWGK